MAPVILLPISCMLFIEILVKDGRLALNVISNTRICELFVEGKDLHPPRFVPHRILDHGV
ncbi:hypothetical protein GGP41_007721 [Bipolaris sorokiniana]|uniref:Uncharacterized protein n=1 Tax=Cochliobolus sativus TaxID=45130 RepID=A0A8H5ZQD0_COCSA|nr:hypothetical protein GGP41_007721 [Bipolaris sorokiniana]